MILAETEKSQKRNYTKKIPESLIYEILDGEIFYYKGYKAVLNGKKKIEEIMGSSTLQSFLIEYFSAILFEKLDRTKYRIFLNESGVHINHKNNVANDIAIYEKSVLTSDKINQKYADVPCKLAIEIDIKADLSEAKDYSYVQRKTQKLLDFGVEKVIWVFTQTQKIMTATLKENWQTMNWDKEIELIDGLSCNIAQYLNDEGIKVEEEAD